MSQQMDELFEHEYDGIQEYDNPMPFWWLGLFYVTIIWAAIYVVYYHVVGIGDTQEAAYYHEVDPTWQNPNPPFVLLKAYIAPLASRGYDPTPRSRAESKGVNLFQAPAEEKQEAVNITAATDPASLQSGQAVYAKNCVACHGLQGQGGVGPNLTDDYWINGKGDINGIATIIKYGVPVKGMIAWGKIISPDDLVHVSSFVLSIRGSNPPNPKAPQGSKVTD